MCAYTGKVAGVWPLWWLLLLLIFIIILVFAIAAFALSSVYRNRGEAYEGILACTFTHISQAFRSYKATIARRLILDLDSTRIQMDALDHTLTPFLICFELPPLLPPR